MVPQRTRLDPDGYYQSLGVEPAATQAEVVAAFRGKARVLHPDVPNTGDAGGFVTVKQAYDVLSNRERRAAYDRKARTEPSDPLRSEPGMGPMGASRATRRDARGAVDPAGDAMRPPNPSGASVPFRGARQPRSFDVPVLVWVVLAAFLCLSVYQAVTHLVFSARAVRADIPPNAATVAPLSPSEHLVVLYGATPVRLDGVANFYVVPGTDPAVLWRQGPDSSALVSLGQLPPFSTVQAIRLNRQNGMLEVRVNEQFNGFISADHLTPGDAAAARRAYCGYNAGPLPFGGELLESHGSGAGTLEMENRSVQPIVVKLRDETGAVVRSVFLGPGGHAAFNDIPTGTYHPEFAIGELWSRACNSFAAGMRARRLEAPLRLPNDHHLTVPPDGGESAVVDIPDQAFERK